MAMRVGTIQASLGGRAKKRWERWVDGSAVALAMTAKTAASAAIKAANAESHAFFEKCTMCPLPLFKRTTECSESRARRSRNLGVYRRQVPPRQGLDRALPPEGTAMVATATMIWLPQDVGCAGSTDHQRCGLSCQQLATSSRKKQVFHERGGV